MYLTNKCLFRFLKQKPATFTKSSLRIRLVEITSRCSKNHNLVSKSQKFMIERKNKTLGNKTD
ncbi:hypothetical protein RyT2_26450 [Pseudolactococcus yaeyamensis]